VVLLALAAIGWAVTIFQARSMGEMAGMPGMSATASPALPFLSVWIAMMVAMMFPSVAPTTAVFAAVGHTRSHAGRRAAPTWAFLLGYLMTWGMFGAGAYLLSLVASDVSMMAPGLRVSHPVIGGLILIFAGVYQWSPLKRLWLGHCRSPLVFFQQEWQEGAIGAFRLGFTHGAHCVGCCAGLMLVLFAVGLMNLGWMALVAAAIFAEKVVPSGPLVGKLAGVAFLVSGVAMSVAPWWGQIFS
jgi:predicted metal-binding membrane protein